MVPSIGVCTHCTFNLLTTHYCTDLSNSKIIIEHEVFFKIKTKKSILNSSKCSHTCDITGFASMASIMGQELVRVKGLEPIR